MTTPPVNRAKVSPPFSEAFLEGERNQWHEPRDVETPLTARPQPLRLPTLFGPRGRWTERSRETDA